METEQAVALARQCLEFTGMAEYFTNGSFFNDGWGGHKVAPGTCDTGVAWVGDDSVGIVWVEDED